MERSDLIRVLTVFRERDAAEPYVEALRAAGMQAVLVSADESAMLDDVNGLLLMGGSDVNPAIYGEEAAEQTEAPDDPRDRLECALIAEALARDVPLLAICRGMQMVNAQQGGTLIQHLATTDHHRRRTTDKAEPAHAVAIQTGTLLAEIAAGETHWSVNSRHHQAVARLARGWRIAAVDPHDGTIEAMDRPGSRFAVAVQWHPENQAPVCEEQARIFRAFAQACTGTEAVQNRT